MKPRIKLLRASFALVLLGVPGECLAQVTSATILGTVRDASGAVLPGATVIATNLGTSLSREAITDDTGQYELPFLPLGTYQVESSLDGFTPFIQSGIVLEVGRQARVDPLLKVGGVSESVVVKADAPLVETRSVAMGRTVNQEEVRNLPLVNRNVYALLSLTAGVDSSRETNDFGVPGQVTLVNGSSNAGGGAVNYFLDGGNNTNGLRNTGNVVPNPDAVQEFRVVTNSYSAEYGRFAGGIVDVVTKSGSNELHGTAFEFVRDDRLNAERWVPDKIPGSSYKDPLKRNQFGGTFGGPVTKNRTFFFASYSGLRQDQSAFANTAVVPTALERAGDFSASARRPADPATGQPFPGGIIPSARFDQVAVRLLNDWVPAANLPNSFYQTTQGRPLDSDELQVKIDHRLSPAHDLSASYFTTRGIDIEPLRGNLPYTERQFKWRQHNVNAGHTWTVSNSTINQLRFTYVRNFGGRINTPAMSLSDLGSTFVLQGPQALPNINVSGYFVLGTAIAGPQAGSNFTQVRDVLSVQKGRHSMRLGGEVALDKVVHDTTLNNYGQFTFDGTKTGNAYADFLLGLPTGNVTQDAPATKYDNGWYVALFAQDDFSLHSRVTLNLGLRYDLQFPYTDPLDRKLTFVPGARSTRVPSAPSGLLFAGEQGVPRGIAETDINNISPRIGVAWDVRGDGTTAVRAGFGVFYGSISANEWNVSGDAQPFTLSGRFTNVKSLADPYGNFPGGVSPFPYVFDESSPRFQNPVVVRGPSRDFTWPYSYQMNVSVQRQLGRSMSATAAYVGTAGRGMRLDRDQNYPVYAAGASTTANVNARRPYQPFGALLITESIASNDYHGAQFTVEKRGARFTVKGYYSVGKALEDVNLQDNTTGNVQNHNDWRNDRARTGSDRRHNLVVSTVWRVDYFGDAGWLLRTLANNWTLSAITSLRSGQPFTVTAGVDANLDGNNNDRANLVDAPTLAGDRSRSGVIAQWFNTAAFARPAAGQDGTAGRNILEGPGLKNVDIGLFRDFGLGRGLTLQLRAEITNAFNLVNLSNPGANLNAPATFGKIRSALDMRQIQLGGKLSF